MVEAQLELLELLHSKNSKQTHTKAVEELDRHGERYILKKRLVVNLLRRGYEKSCIRSLLQFIDWMMQLSEEEERELKREITEETGGENMPYVTSWERIAKKEGMEIGEKRGKLIEKQNLLIHLLNRKFAITTEEKSLIEETENTFKLDEALDIILFAQSKDEVLDKLRC